MKILEINKFYFQESGTTRYLFDLIDLLHRHGHEVMAFSMKDPRNKPTRWSRYFVDQLDLSSPSFSPRKFFHIIYSTQARRRILELLTEEQPDIAHIHNIYHHLSPSILGVLKKAGIPIVMSVHDYKLISPNYALFGHGKVDECARGGRFYRVLLHSCFKDSFWASLAVVIEAYIHRWFRFYEKYVDRFIVPSEFVRAKLIEYGLPAERIVVMPHFIRQRGARDTHPRVGDYLLYFGRLSPEKGIDTLIEALYTTRLPYQLHIAGTGPFEKRLIDLVHKRELTQYVTFVGHLDGADLAEEINNARAIVVPSQSYETFGMTALEAMNRGKAVIASRIGALPELIIDGRTGFLYDPHNRIELERVLGVIIPQTELLARVGAAAQTAVTGRYQEEEYYQKLIALFTDVCQSGSSSSSHAS